MDLFEVLKMLKRIIPALGYFLCLIACAGVQKDDADAINDALVGFTTCTQSERWSESLQYVTEDEVEQMTEGGVLKEEYRKAASRVNLSAMRRMQWAVDSEGRLIGIKQVLDKINPRFAVSKEQTKIGTEDYFEKQEQRRIESRLEEGRRIMEEEQNRDTEQQVEVMTNRLTDEEKKKYGSTGDLLKPEEFSNQNTEEAKEEIGYYGEATSSEQVAEPQEETPKTSTSEEPQAESSFEEEGYYGD